MRRLRLAATAATPLIVLMCATSAQAVTRTCDPVAFEQNSDNTTGPIRAKNVSCRTARAVARKSNGRGPTGNPGQVRRYKSRGFSCRGYETDEGLPIMKWTCKRKGSRITFEKG